MGFHVEYSMELSWNTTFSMVILQSTPRGIPRESPWKISFVFAPVEFHGV